MIRTVLATIFVITAGATAVAPAVASDGTLDSPRTWIEAEVHGDLPPDLIRPEGKTRWDLRGLQTASRFDLQILQPGDDGVWRSVRTGLARERTRIETESWAGRERSEVAQWLQPESVGGFERAGARPPLRLTRLADDGAGVSYWVAPRRLGVGWLLLDSGRFEVFLERSRVYRIAADGAGYSLEQTVDRWIEPRIGVVAEVSRAADGSEDSTEALPPQIREVRAIGPFLRGPAGLKIYSDQVNLPPLTRLAYGFDRGAGIPISTITPDGVGTMAQLTALGAWDFSGTVEGNSVAETASSSVAVNSAETCNFDQCGFNLPNVTMSREDKNFDDLPNLNVTLSVIEEEQRAGDVTLWLRGGARNEGQSGAFGDGETRLCYTGGGRTAVPLWQFPNQDAEGFYFTDGDSWSSGTFSCEQNVNNHVCPNSCGLFCPIYTAACGDFDGNQRGAVIGGGPVTLPSGHTFMASVVYNVAEFCVYIGSGCGVPVDNARTATYLWQVPYLGTVARLMSPQVATPNEFDFTTLDETDIKYGLFPPLSITVDNVADSSVTISWNPGSDTRRIDGFKLYWDTDSGGDSAYAFDSFLQAGQVQIVGTSATVSGLTSGTEYFFTVTSLSDYTDPRSGVMTQYESLVFPTTVASQAGGSLPVEVSATTTGGACTPIAEVTGLTVDDAGAGQIEICWDATADPCAEGYSIRGAASPESDLGFTDITTTGLVTCRTLASASGYFLVHADGGGGEGPWGHFGR